MAVVWRGQCVLVELLSVLPLLELSQLVLQTPLLSGQNLDVLLHLRDQGTLILRHF
jgi:hypothetical protein